MVLCTAKTKQPAQQITTFISTTCSTCDFQMQLHSKWHNWLDEKLTWGPITEPFRSTVTITRKGIRSMFRILFYLLDSEQRQKSKNTRRTWPTILASAYRSLQDTYDSSWMFWDYSSGRNIWMFKAERCREGINLIARPGDHSSGSWNLSLRIWMCSDWHLRSPLIRSAMLSRQEWI